VLKILATISDQYIQCSLNLDYDCDSIVNIQDNCPYDYNPQQRDMNHNGKGNVCDEDIDGDGIKNPLGIVDDNDVIIIGKWDNKADQTPL